MGVTGKSISAFNSGEISPEASGRFDIRKYEFALGTCKNFLPKPEGGTHKIPGTRYLSNVIDNSKKSRLIPFTFSTSESYIFEFSDKKIVIFNENGFIQHSTKSNVNINSSTISGSILGPNGTSEVAMPFDLGDNAFSHHGLYHNQGPFQIELVGGATIPSGLSTLTDYWVHIPQPITWDDTMIYGGSNNRIDLGSAHNIPSSSDYYLIRFSTNRGLPTNVEANKDYRLIYVSSTQIEIQTTSGGVVNMSPTRSDSTGQEHKILFTTQHTRERFRIAPSINGTPIDIGPVVTADQFNIVFPNPIKVEVDSPYLESELDDIKFTQSGDIIYLAHKSHPPVQIRRIGSDVFELDAINIVDGPYEAENTDDSLTIQSSAITAGLETTLTVNDPLLINNGKGFDESFIGKLVRIKSGSNWGYVEITGYNEFPPTGASAPEKAYGTIRKGLSSTTATSNFRFSTYGGGNYPSSIAISEQRLWLGGGVDTPQIITASRTSDFLNFEPSDKDGTVTDSSGFSFSIGSGRYDEILWIMSANDIYVGTYGSIFVAKASIAGDPITPTNINFRSISAQGAASAQPTSFGSEVFAATRNSQSVLSIESGLNLESFDVQDMTVLSKHILGRNDSVTEIVGQIERTPIVWILLSDGSVVAASRLKSEDVTGWFRLEVGGSFGSGKAVVESIAVIPSDDRVRDVLWMIVKRTVNGSTVRHIEYMEDEFFGDDAKNQRFCSAAPTPYSGAPTSTVSGLSHLEGETVRVLADGSIHPDRIVSSGSITLDASYSDVYVGLPYKAEMETLPLELPDRAGPTMGKSARLDHVYIRSLWSYEFDIGGSSSSTDKAGETDGVTKLKDYKVLFNAGFQREKRIYIASDVQAACNILAINVRGATGNR